MSNKQPQKPPAWTYKAAALSRSNRIRTDYEQNPNFCQNCREKLPFEKKRNKFCSSSCSASFNNRGVVHNPKKHSEFCASCGGQKETLANKYCNKCANDYVYVTKPLDMYTTDRHRKAFLVRQRGHHCQECGLSEWRGLPIPLDLDHIDGDPDNNVEENLRLICPNCHAQTDTYKGKGIVNGRNSARKTMRRKRYQNGQSY